MSSTADNEVFPITVGQVEPEPCQELVGLEPKDYTKRHTLIRAAEWGMVSYETTQADDYVRYLLLGGTYAITRDPVISASVYGLTTLGTETAAGLAAADLLGSEKSEKFIAKINKVLEKLKISPDARVHKIAKAVIALYLGTPTYLGMHQRENPARSLEDNKRTAKRSAAAIAGVCAVEGYAFSSSANSVIAGVEKGIEQVHPEYVIPALVAVGGVKVAVNRAMSNFKKAETAEPRYDLASEELVELEQSLLRIVEEQSPQQGLYATWVNPRNPHANIVRTYEIQYFPEAAEVFPEEDEDASMQLLLVDTRKGAERVIHGGTIMGPTVSPNNKISRRKLARRGVTGFYTVDSLLALNDFTAKEFQEYYKRKDIDPYRCIAVETTFRIGERAELFCGLDSASIAYLKIFDKLTENVDPKQKKVAVFASINQPSVKSFKRVGLEFEPLMGKTGLRTPESERGKDDFLPVCIPSSPHNLELFRLMQGVEIPEIGL